MVLSRHRDYSVPAGADGIVIAAFGAEVAIPNQILLAEFLPQQDHDAIGGGRVFALQQIPLSSGDGILLDIDLFVRDRLCLYDQLWRGGWLQLDHAHGTGAGWIAKLAERNKGSRSRRDFVDPSRREERANRVYVSDKQRRRAAKDQVRRYLYLLTGP